MTTDNNKPTAEVPDIAFAVAAAEQELNAGNYAEASRLVTQVQQASDPQSSADRLHIASALRVLGSIARRRGDYAQALEDYNAALRMSEASHDNDSIAKALGSIGTVHLNLSDFPKALEYYSKALALHEELDSKSGVASWLGNIGQVHLNLSDYPKALEYYSKALALDEELANKTGVAIHLGNIGNVHWNLSDYAEALAYYLRALAMDEELDDKAGEASWLGNIGNVYSNLSDYPKALEYYSKALALDEKLGTKMEMANHLGNIGIVHAELSDFSTSLEYFSKALALADEIGNKAGVAIHLANIGGAHLGLSDYSKALEYYSKALALSEELGNKQATANCLRNLGTVYATQMDYARAQEYLHRAMFIQEELGLKSDAGDSRGVIGGLYANRENPGRDEAKAEEYLLEAIAVNHALGTKEYAAHQTLAELYKAQGRFSEAFDQLENYQKLKDEVQSEHARKKASQLEQQKQIAEREKEIEIARTAADAKLNATTVLLHKVLPPSIAQRMIEGEEEIADYFPQVSILFADIAGFTPISADMPAYIVVRFLNFVFREFDRIMEKHGCEKIKTIGDGYMAVARAPVECADHAERVTAAALDMQKVIELPEEIREHLPEGAKFGVRIGLHTGSIVGGVIGEKRFVYDVYSDAVNTAARMESHGEPDRIHVTHDFVRHLQNRFSSAKNTTHGLTFEKRGEMQIKGKGVMRTYFLEKGTDASRELW